MRKKTQPNQSMNESMKPYPAPDEVPGPNGIAMVMFPQYHCMVLRSPMNNPHTKPSRYALSYRAISIIFLPWKGDWISLANTHQTPDFLLVYLFQKKYFIEVGEWPTKAGKLECGRWI